MSDQNAGSTSLLALSAIALDIETTGLDPRKARAIEIGAVEWLPARQHGAANFQSFLAPGEPLPPSTIAITGIGEDMLRGAPAFAGAFGALRAFAGERVVIGHSTGFDFAVFDAECKRAGVAPWRPVTLDTRYLAQAAFPGLADYSLETVARRCGVELDSRHRALGDAMSCARVMSALVAPLRERGIRTLGEALAASLRLMEGENRPDLWAEPSRASDIAAVSGPDGSTDPFLFNKRVEDVMAGAPAFVSPDSDLGAAIKAMAERKIGSLLVGDAQQPATDIGIVTERDVLRALARHGAAALDKPVAQFASRPLQTVPAQAFLYRAVGRMNRLSIRHLAAINDQGRVTGIISSRDLMRSRMSGPVALGDGIDTAADEIELARVWSGLPGVARELRLAGLGGRAIAEVIGREVAALTRRAAQFAEMRMNADGLGPPPCAFSVMVLGSAGRGESLLAFDQDNAIVFADGEEGGAEDRWFARFGGIMCDTLHRTGVPNCLGGVMAKNAPWRGSAAIWKARAQRWISRSSPQDLLSVDIAFDMRPVHGDLALGQDVWTAMWDAARGQIAFLKLLAEAAGAPEPAFGFFGRLRTHDGAIDLKRLGLKSIVGAARILAMHEGLRERATAARLRAVAAASGSHAQDFESLDRAHEAFVTHILDQQLADLGAGLRTSNRLAVSRLSASARNALSDHLRTVEVIPEIVRDRLSG